VRRGRSVRHRRTGPERTSAGAARSPPRRGIDVTNQYPRRLAAEAARGQAPNPTARSVRSGRCARALCGTRTHTMRAAVAAIGTHGAAAYHTAYSLVCFPAARCDAGGPLRSPPLPLGAYSHLRDQCVQCVQCVLCAEAGAGARALEL
jgi:hypothetical protein